MSHGAHQSADVLRAKRIGIDTYREPVIFLAAISPVCRAEGWTAHARIDVSHLGRSIAATLHVVNNGLLGEDEAGLSNIAWELLSVADGDLVRLSHAAPLESIGAVRAKVYGHVVSPSAMETIVRDIVDGRYSDIELAAFVTAFAGPTADRTETIALTRAIIQTGERLYWGHTPIVDKHCVGGLPGNRTSLIVVPIVAACGLTIPKTSSRAITSPAGSADVMETLAPVSLDLPAIRRVVEREGGCIVWGGAVRLAPADDIIISVERPLDIDSAMQLVASVLAKKAAAGATHVVIDMPVGPTAKVRSDEAATALEALLVGVAMELGLAIRVLRTDGRQPVGRGIGPALEARDVLAVLNNEPSAPRDLRDRALALAGELLELGGAVATGAGRARACEVLTSGAAREKFQAICTAQGGMREPPRAAHTHVIQATHRGRIIAIDNRRLARVAKLAGAPRALAAGLELHAPLGTIVDRGQPLFTVHAETPGELDYAGRYLRVNPQVLELEQL
ncbi:MAG TPA: thymidine phosphorylase family protein [Gemmatimonadaceae bacterium]